MKKLLLIIFLLPLFCNAQKVVYGGYASFYNAKLLIPDSVIWVAHPHKKVCDREASFHATGGRVNVNKDYAHSGYDLGHLCDASDENGNKQDEYNSFDLINVFPQRPNLNRKTWLALEDYTRKLNQDVKVKASWVGIIGYLKPDNVAIPKYCVKELWYGKTYEKYIMPNNDTVSNHDFKFYKVK